MNKCARAERGTRVCEIFPPMPQIRVKVHLSGNYRVREIPSGPGRPRAPRVRRDAPAPAIAAPRPIANSWPRRGTAHAAVHRGRDVAGGRH